MVAATQTQDTPTVPVLRREDVDTLIPGVDLWDFWPIQHRDGTVAEFTGGPLFVMLAAPILPDPDDRHAIARLRLCQRTAAGWRDLGYLLPGDLSPGSREWAGSAVLSDDARSITLYFTAAGRRGEKALSFEQRLFETRAMVEAGETGVRLVDWTAPVESIAADGLTYMRNMTGGGGIGTIKAFRDPGYFRDPADGREYLLFTASLAGSRSEWNGAIGVACHAGEQGWLLRPPLISADGVNNELERPHIVTCAGRYYLFFSTQAKVFAEGGPAGPTGLYGFVADRFDGPWRPLNETGLVLANPRAAPAQAYSWIVMSDLSVLSFADMVGLDRPPADVADARAHFAGGPAPSIQLVLDGDRAWPL